MCANSVANRLAAVRAAKDRMKRASATATTVIGVKRVAVAGADRPLSMRVQRAAFEQAKKRVVEQYSAPHVEPRKTLRSKVAYRVTTNNGSAVLCERHLDLLRSHESGVKYTGETFAVALCDHCHPNET